MKYIFNLLLIGFFSLCLVNAPVMAQQNQDLKLAQQYFNKGEYEKATPLYKKLYETANTNSYYYKNYLKCLVAVKDFEAATKLIKKQRKKRKGDPTLLIDMGYIYKQQDQPEKANAEFDKAISQLDSKSNSIRNMANSFNQLEEPDYAIQCYLKGKELTKDPNAFSYELANSFKKAGEYNKMIEHYLNYVSVQPEKEQTVKNEFQKVIGFEKHRDALESQLYRRIQNNPEQLLYPQFLVWLFVQEKNYDDAFIQVKAIDQRLNEDGQRVFDLAHSAAIDNQYTAAIEGYKYVLSKGSSNPMYELARIAMIETKMKKLQYDTDYTDLELQELEADHLTLLEELGRNPSTTSAMTSLSNLYAFYLFDLDKAIDILEEIIAMPAAGKQVRAYSKLDLGDYYIMKDDVWEATLYYSQVDKEFKDDILGEDARFRNAKLSYYTGDFEWAQAQLNILKASTSELISNDALELSVFIMDNLGLDTSLVAMNMFARADLFIFQNNTEASYEVLDSIDNMFPGHALADDIIYRRGQIEFQKRNYEKAVEHWEKVLTDFPTDILADNALFYLADLYENYLDQKPKAKDYYQNIIVNYPGSLFIIEARKRFRKLRGDTIN